MRFFEILAENWNEGRPRDGRIPVVTQTGEEPRFLYRVMSPAEFAAAEKTGVLRSRDDRIHAAERPHLQYCQPGVNLIVRIDYHFEDGWRAKWAADEVVAIADEVPFDRLTIVARGSRTELEDQLR
jgi:hypothetical protein